MTVRIYIIRANRNVEFQTSATVPDLAALAVDSYLRKLRTGDKLKLKVKP